MLISQKVSDESNTEVRMENQSLGSYCDGTSSKSVDQLRLTRLQQNPS